MDLTQQIQKAEQEARKRLDTVFKQAQQSGWTADGNLTIRDRHLCIPILAENKRKLKGLIHDESATGQTVFMEPEEVFHLNNKVRDLSFKHRREMVRVLTELTLELHPHVSLLLSYDGLLTKIDFVRAKALFAIDLDAQMPELSKDAENILVNARHPLLMLSAKQDEHHTVVPLNLRIDLTDRVLLVSSLQRRREIGVHENGWPSAIDVAIWIINSLRSGIFRLGVNSNRFLRILGMINRSTVI